MVRNRNTKKPRPSASRRQPKTNIAVRICILVFLAALIAGSIYLLKNPEIITTLSPKRSISSIKPEIAPSTPGVQEKSASIKLYFADPESDLLKMEARGVNWKEDDLPQQMRVILEELIKGPRGTLVQTIPGRVRIRDLRVADNGLAIIDFSRELSRNHPGGSAAEMLTIYSIVDSLLLNLPSLKQVQILVEGESPDTLKGHIDCRAPFEANVSLIKAG